MACLKVPDNDWQIITELARRPEHLRTPPQMANYLIRKGLLEEQTKLGRQIRQDGK